LNDYFLPQMRGLSSIWGYLCVFIGNGGQRGSAVVDPPFCWQFGKNLLGGMGGNCFVHSDLNAEGDITL
jgi:hypothetical protein